jgi:hypothetical protein
MKRHLVSLADAYTGHWVHRAMEARGRKNFLGIQSEGPSEESSSDSHITVVAELFIVRDNEELREDRYSREPAYVSGFKARLWETDGMGSGQTVLEHAYLMDHIPVPTYERIRR